MQYQLREAIRALPCFAEQLPFSGKVFLKKNNVISLSTAWGGRIDRQKTVFLSTLMWNRSYPTRTTRIIAVLFTGTLILGWTLYPTESSIYSPELPAPEPLPSASVLTADEAVRILGHPTFGDVWNYERALPQHVKPSRIVASTKEKGPRYLRIPHSSWGTGWNNVFQEQLFNAHLAHMSDRAYVFPEYIPRDHPPYPDTLPNGTRHMLHIPMNTFVAGPIGGGPFADNPVDDKLTRRSISEAWWDVVCPRERVKVLNVFEVHGSFGYDAIAVEGAEILTRWSKKLSEMDDMCVSVEEYSIFHYVFMGGQWVTSAWPSYGASPVLRYFAWSPLVTATLFRNFHAIAPHQSAPPIYLAPLRELSSATDVNPFEYFSPLPASSLKTPIPGLLGIHVRRGDYEGHCGFLAAIDCPYNSWNNLGTPGLIANASLAAQRWLGFGGNVDDTTVWPRLNDHLDIPEGMTRKEAIVYHCLPDVKRIVHKAATVRAQSETKRLKTLFIATNGNKEWVAELVQALRADGWEHVATSLDLELGVEAYAVSHAVDMGILTALSEEFIGVGFSSLSSNVAQIRLGAGANPKTIHFW
ncbi:SH3 and PX-domain-containing 3 [Mycena indigotica]|uniref:SH3 and PX-domain-containing 3 n=1 Tax=Mycena indigotica TaxID=2126181 RepID=A0A8H6S550_9AGAR|nr:SH3 and PX-domain-containing 3 [Mycena indigotica]KAF7293074.1 SH3 and PX-domain-containing 3 [Mycena indigotica]